MLPTLITKRALNARCVNLYKASVRCYSTSPSTDSAPDKSVSRLFEKEPRVLIVGGGVHGLTTALALNSQGISSQVVGGEVNDLGSVYIGINGMRVLKQISPTLYQNVKQAGQNITALEIFNKKGKYFGRADFAPLGRSFDDVAPVGISTSTLQSILMKECQRAPSKNGKGKIHIDKASPFITGIGEPGTPVLCRFGSGRMSSMYDVVVGADGTNSKVRDEYFVGPEYNIKKKFCGFAMLSAVVERPFMFNSNVITEMWGDEKRIMGIPLNDELVQLLGAYMSPYPLHLQLESDKAAGELTKQFPLFGGFVPHVAYSLETSKKPCKLLLPKEIKMDKYSHGRMVLIGNAAHSIAPNIHMADTLAFEDAIVLADCLANSNLPIIEDRLDAYSALRVRRVNKISEMANKITKIGHRGKIGLALLTPWEIRQGNLQARERALIESEFTLPQSSPKNT